LLLLAPNQGNNGTVEFTWRGLELIVGNYYVLTLLVFIGATACALVLSRRLRPERAAPALLTDPPPSSSQAPNPCKWVPGLGWRSHREAASGPFGLPDPA
jgi:hypothetical protein